MISTPSRCSLNAQLFATFLALFGVVLIPAKGAPDGRAAGIWYGVEVPRPKAPGAVRLATYNVENLFDGDDDPTLSGANEDLSEQTSESRLRGLAEVIRKLDADVLCLEEVESLKCLEWFRDKYLNGLGYKHAASIDAGYYRGVEQSILSRFPISDAHVFADAQNKLDDAEVQRTPERAAQLGGNWSEKNPQSGHYFQRAPLVANLRIGEKYSLTVIVAHFKAGSYAHQRELEAIRILDVVSGLLRDDPSKNLAVVGDFNATPNAMSVKALRLSDVGLVSAYDFRFDLQAPFAAYATHATGRPLDYILMSKGLAADCVPSSYFVLGTLHPASTWDYRRAKEIPAPDGYASDHYPVVVDFSPMLDKGPSEFHPPRLASDSATSVAPSTLGTGEIDSVQPSQRESHGDAAMTHDRIPLAAAKPAGLKLRPLTSRVVPEADAKLAEQLVDAGWTYRMPRPKSSQAAWGVRNARTTWWNGYWVNSKSSKTSASQPLASDGFAGDGKGGESWRRGGSPVRPSIVEWLCSDTEGVEPESIRTEP